MSRSSSSGRPGRRPSRPARSPGDRAGPPGQPPYIYYEPPAGPDRAGYTPPTRPTPPPASWGGRGRLAWQSYRGLRRRSRANSMAWWWLKVVQGAALSALIIVVGLVISLIAEFAGAGVWLSRLGLLMIVFGVLVALRYLLAPITCRWIVTVPENYYYVVEDQDGYTIEYLGPGRMIVPWRWGSVVKDYVDFNTITVTEAVQDVLNSEALPVDLEVSVILFFNPVEADPAMYAALRKFRWQEQFQTMIARDVYDTVRRYLDTLETAQGQRSAANVHSVEWAVAQELEKYAPMGLFLASGRPVTVHVRVPQRVKEAYESLWARTARLREESQLLLEVKELARKLALPYEDALQLFQIMPRGAPADQSAAGPSVSGLPPVYVVQARDPTPPPSSPVEPPPAASPVSAAAVTAEHEAVKLPPDQPAPTPDQAPPAPHPERGQPPDPLDLRRQRRRSRSPR